MQRVELVLGLVVLALWIYCLVSCIITPESQVRSVPKAIWLVVIVLLPLLGSVLWLGVGRERIARAPRVQPARGSIAPTTGAGYAALSSEERIRRMEEDLARLEQEAAPERLPPEAHPGEGRGLPDRG